MSGISAVAGVGGSYPAPAVPTAPALPGAVMASVDTSVLDATLLQQATVYQLLKVGGGQAFQVLNGGPPALGQQGDALA